MKDNTTKIISLETISDIHRLIQIPGPTHPLITMLEAKELTAACELPVSYLQSFYQITFITKMEGKFRYGQDTYDFKEGSLVFAAPNQIVGGIVSGDHNEGVSLFIHPDFFQGFSLATKIKQYGFFSYSNKEALHLSDQEKDTIQAVFKIIKDELNNRIDDFSQELIVSQIELVLTYAKRFYNRQFITRQPFNSKLLTNFEVLLENYLQEGIVHNGIPSVQYFADKLHYTPNYLSDMLRSLTGLNTQQHIHNKVIENAKEILSTTDLSVAEVAYQLGFEYPQSLTRLFKSKTNQSPVEFRKSFN